MARVMLVFYIFLTCQIVLSLKCTNSTCSPRRMILDEGGRVVDAVTRIIGGETVHIKVYPYAVSIQWRMGTQHHCGGTYILPRFILSAAHCMIKRKGVNWEPENPKFFIILAGSTNLKYSPTWQISVPDAILPHPDYSYRRKHNDIGLFRIPRPFRITPYVSYAPLPNDEDPDLLKKNEVPCTVIGWGKTAEFDNRGSDTLQHAKVPLIENCAQFFSHTLPPSQICAGKLEGGVDACQGDSGGPLLCNGTQIGIVSWGYGCAAPRSPGVYIRVDNYLDWITATTLKNNAFPNKNPLIDIWICIIYSMIITYL